MTGTMKIVLSIAAYIIFAPVLGGLMSGVDRKITARMQGRQGPPIFQAFYDVIKLMKKETVYVNHVQIFYLLIFLVFVIFTGCLFFGGFGQHRHFLGRLFHSQAAAFLRALSEPGKHARQQRLFRTLPAAGKKGVRQGCHGFGGNPDRHVVQ